jgi:thioesterase domain-containing protein
MALAEALGPDQPLYGMRSGHQVMPYTEANIQTLATTYRRELQALCPNGPYFIGGNCQGGLIALAMAQQLWRLHEPVALLTLLEWAFGPQPYQGRLALMWGETSEMNPYTEVRDPSALLARLYPEHTVDMLPAPHRAFFAAGQVERLAQRVAARVGEAVRVPPQ